MTRIAAATYGARAATYGGPGQFGIAWMHGGMLTDDATNGDRTMRIANRLGRNASLQMANTTPVHVVFALIKFIYAPHYSDLER
jgi:hypothetical protein